MLTRQLVLAVYTATEAMKARYDASTAKAPAAESYAAIRAEAKRLRTGTALTA